MTAAGARATGIQRKVDDLGRVVIPAGIRRSLDIREGDLVDVSVTEGAVVLSKPAVRCGLCGADDEPLHDVGHDAEGKQLCRPCVTQVASLWIRQRGQDPSDEAIMATPERRRPTRPASEPARTDPPLPVVPGRRRADHEVAGRPRTPRGYDSPSTTAW